MDVMRGPHFWKQDEREINVFQHTEKEAKLKPCLSELAQVTF
jgi:hypothetical protein